MIRQRDIPTLSPADRARQRVLQQEARRRRLERLILSAIDERRDYVECMEGEAYFKPDVIHHKDDQWECAELSRINRNRPPSRVCFTLPWAAYEQSRCRRYACWGEKGDYR